MLFGEGESQRTSPGLGAALRGPHIDCFKRVAKARLETWQGPCALTHMHKQRLCQQISRVKCSSVPLTTAAQEELKLFMLKGLWDTTQHFWQAGDWAE